jgi:hypothetical protein
VICELIERVEDEKEVLKRNEKFGMDYIELSEMCGK